MYVHLCVFISFIQNNQLDNVYLVPTDPHDACGELVNAAAIMNNVAFVERG